MRELEEFIYEHVLDSSAYDSITIDEFSYDQLIKIKSLVESAIDNKLKENRWQINKWL